MLQLEQWDHFSHSQQTHHFSRLTVMQVSVLRLRLTDSRERRMNSVSRFSNVQSIQVLKNAGSQRMQTTFST
jgi:hypothetical protein